MTKSERDTDTLCNKIFSEFDEWRTVDSINNRISMALTQQETIEEKRAWEALQSYQQDIPKDDVDTSIVYEERDCVQRELEIAEDSLATRGQELYDDIVEKLELLLDQTCNDDTRIKDQIIILKRTLQRDLTPQMLADAIGCSRGYPSQYTWDEDEQRVVMRDGVRDRHNHRFSESQKQQIHERDGKQCVSCGDENELRAHHIIPIEHGGEGIIENGATLCKECHDALHRFGKGYSYDYDSVEDFWTWTRNNKNSE
jgi:hypothetical protein